MDMLSKNIQTIWPDCTTHFRSIGICTFRGIGIPSMGIYKLFNGGALCCCLHSFHRYLYYVVGMVTIGIYTCTLYIIVVYRAYIVVAVVSIDICKLHFLVGFITLQCNNEDILLISLSMALPL